MTPGSLRRWWPLAAVVLLLALAAVAAAHSSPQLERVNRPDTALDGAEFEQREAESVEQPGDAVDTEPTRVPGWLITTAVVIGGALVAVLLGVMVWNLARDLTRRRRSGRMPPPALAPPGATADEVVAALDAGLDDLSDADRDPRRAVIACWLRLEQAAAAAGTPRQAADTPTDLVTRLLRGHHVSADVLAGFAHVYREARYATHSVDERMRGQARAALQRLRGELTSSGHGMSRESAAVMEGRAL
jgi:multisubunit Na+/H+ antiporter MnhC subunit